MLSALALAGCGFAPTYGPDGSATALRGQISLKDPSDRDTYDLHAELVRVFGEAQAPRYRLTYDIATEESAVGITPTQEITRYHVVGTVSYVLIDADSGQTTASGSVQSFTAYSATGTSVSTLAAKRDANERLMVILAQRISADLQAKVATRS